jgi:hypothetical protein
MRNLDEKGSIPAGIAEQLRGTWLQREVEKALTATRISFSPNTQMETRIELTKPKHAEDK